MPFCCHTVRLRCACAAAMMLLLSSDDSNDYVIFGDRLAGAMLKHCRFVIALL